MKKISILIPTHKGREKFVKIILDSLENQTYKNFNVIICDNDSTKDKVPEYIKNYDYDIRYIVNNTNLGPQKNIMKLISLVESEYFKFILSDDLISDDFLEKTINLFDTKNDIDAIFTKRIFIDEFGKKTGEANFHEYDKSRIFDAKELFKISCEKVDWFAGELTNFIFKNKKYNYDELFTPSFTCKDNSFVCSYDLILFLNLLSKNSKVYFLNEPLCMIRNHDDRTLLQYDSRVTCKLDYVYFIKECYELGYIEKNIFEERSFELLNEAFYFLESYDKLSLKTMFYLKNFAKFVLQQMKSLYKNCNNPFISLDYVFDFKLKKEIFKKADRKIVVFGTGEYSRQFFSNNKEFLDKVFCFMDDNLVGEEFFGKKIIKRDFIDGAIYFVSSTKYKDIIVKNLVDMGVNKKDIFVL